MNYREAISYIIERSGYDKGFVANPFDAETVGLRRTEWLLQALGHPERRYPTVHIAGTKGKGSTAAAVAAIQRAAGRRVGLYTSPHLHTFRERIQLDGEPIDEAAFAELVGELAPLNARLAEERPEWGEATAFEVATVLALLAFARSQVSIAVVEVGLGGRLDATNVILPEVAAITSISLDHTRILGDTLEQIAAEKGGIIKPGRPVVSSPQRPEAAATLERIAAERGSPFFIGGRDWQVAGSTEQFDLTGPWGSYADLRVGLRGAHQLDNAATAVAACWALAGRGISTSEESIRAGLAGVNWPGRFEIVRRQPAVVVDGAHNVDSAERLAAALRDAYGERPVTLILGIASDKNVTGMVRALAPLAGTLIATTSHNPRAAGPERIATAARETDDSSRVVEVPTVAEALRQALAVAAPDAVIVVTGSLYAVAEAREALGLARSDDFERALLYR